VTPITIRSNQSSARCGEKPRNTLRHGTRVIEEAESLSKIFAAVLIPVVLGVASLLANHALERSKTRDELLKQAIDVVFLSKSDQMAGADKSFESRRAHRSHWLEIYNSLADVKLSQDFIAIMMELDTRVDGTELYTIENRPALIPNTERPESTNEDELGHGWVTVGRLNSDRYSEANFTVPPQATNRDGTIKPREIIRARWSVSLRSNSRNLEDRQGYTVIDEHDGFTAALPTGTRASVYPSGGDLATAAMAILPLAPVQFSTTTAWPHFCARRSPMMRASASGAPPAAKRDDDADLPRRMCQ
jgi:hypothetical protein